MLVDLNVKYINIFEKIVYLICVTVTGEQEARLALLTVLNRWRPSIEPIFSVISEHRFAPLKKDSVDFAHKLVAWFKIIV